MCQETGVRDRVTDECISAGDRFKSNAGQCYSHSMMVAFVKAQLTRNAEMGYPRTQVPRDPMAGSNLTSDDMERLGFRLVENAWYHGDEQLDMHTDEYEDDEEEEEEDEEEEEEDEDAMGVTQLMRLARATALAPDEFDNMSVLAESTFDNVNAQDYYGQTALHYAVLADPTLGDHVENMRQLIVHNADLNQADSGGTTPLMLAIQSNMQDLVFLLISSGANVHLRDRRGDSAIHMAAHTGNVSVVSRLYHQGVGLYSSTWSSPRNTPLIIAARRGHQQLVVWLLDQGVDRLVENSQRRNALYYAEQAGHAAVAHTLRTHIAPAAILNRVIWGRWR